MKAPALVAFLLLQSIEPLRQEGPYEDHSVCKTQCAPIKQDVPGVAGCACPSSKGEGCDPEGNRIPHAMEGCVNGKNCYRHCCKCCPRD